jgi:hypothetical protein
MEIVIIWSHQLYYCIVLLLASLVDLKLKSVLHSLVTAWYQGREFLPWGYGKKDIYEKG